MRTNACYWVLILALVFSSAGLVRGAAKNKEPQPQFHTSDRCLACHNGLTTPSGKDVSIGFDWRASIMANSSRDPYWQGSVRRESIDHPEVTSHIEDECSVCHMPITRYEAKSQGKEGQVFAHLPFSNGDKGNADAEDGVTCSVCHQISDKNLGTPQSYNGQFVVYSPKSKNDHPEFGPFAIQQGQQRIMDTSTGGFMPQPAPQIRDSALCGSCHTLKTEARGPGGKVIGALPEQMPYVEWKHSSYYNNVSCQQCHMPEVVGEAPIAAVLGPLRTGLHQHVFYGGNFFLARVLNTYRDELSVAAMPQELTNAAAGTMEFLQSQAARVTIRHISSDSAGLHLEVFVQNQTGHKMPTAYPSRRAWLHVTVKDNGGHTVFESGKLNADGSIVGNDNDADPLKYEPHYREITSSDQVEIFEPILKDANGRVTTGLLSAVGYLKDNRLLPSGFQKQTAEKDIEVVGDAADDPNFTDAGALVKYAVATGNAQGPFHVEAELWYQPIGFRWAHNLGFYKAMEPQRFVRYYEALSSSTGMILAKAEATQ